MPMPSRSASAGWRSITGVSPTSRVPASDRSSPKQMFISVVLPAPFSPTSAWISPAFTSKSTPSFATSAPNRLLIPRASSSGGPASLAPWPGASPLMRPSYGQIARGHSFLVLPLPLGEARGEGASLVLPLPASGGGAGGIGPSTPVVLPLSDGRGGQGGEVRWLRRAASCARLVGIVGLTVGGG